ncbi:MAG: hypothetical protein QM757_26405 [Paludibaculum sp.]
MPGHVSISSLLRSQLTKIYQNINTKKPLAPFPSPVHSFTRVLTLAEVTAMHAAPLQLLPDLKNVTVRPIDLSITGAGVFNNFTNFVLQDTNAAPVAVATLTLAAINAGRSFPATAGVTLGAGFQGGLTLGKGLAVRTSGGTAAGTGTSITITVLYEIVE